jgi:hypothetical protein
MQNNNEKKSDNTPKVGFFCNLLQKVVFFRKYKHCFMDYL